jgi:hypothetical protein
MKHWVIKVDSTVEESGALEAKADSVETRGGYLWLTKVIRADWHVPVLVIKPELWFAVWEIKP